MPKREVAALASLSAVLVPLSALPLASVSALVVPLPLLKELCQMEESSVASHLARRYCSSPHRVPGPDLLVARSRRTDRSSPQYSGSRSDQSRYCAPQTGYANLRASAPPKPGPVPQGRQEPSL